MSNLHTSVCWDLGSSRTFATVTFHLTQGGVPQCGSPCLGAASGTSVLYICVRFWDSCALYMSPGISCHVLLRPRLH
jgi:hypothetical protein